MDDRRMGADSASNVLQHARRALDSSPIFALRELEVEVCGESLILSGKVSTFYQKQQAQELVRGIAEGCQLVNSIDVKNGAGGIND